MAPRHRRRRSQGDLEREFSPYTRPKSHHRETWLMRQARSWSERLSYLIAAFWRRLIRWGWSLDRRWLGHHQPGSSSSNSSRRRHRRSRRGEGSGSERRLSTERRRSEHDRPEHDRPEHDRPEHDRPEHDRPEHDRSEHDRSEYGRSEHSRSEHRPSEPAAPLPPNQPSQQFAADQPGSESPFQAAQDSASGFLTPRAAKQGSHGRSRRHKQRSGARRSSARTRSARTSSRRPSSRYWLGWAAAGLCLASLALGLFYGRQVQRERLAQSLQKQIAQCADTANWSQAARLGNQYLEIRPDDNAARLAMARHFGLAARTDAERREAVDLYERTLRMVGDDGEVRGQLAETLLALGRDTEAQQQAERLVKTHPKHPLAWRVLAETAFRQARAAETANYARPIELGLQALEYDPTNIELAESVARACRDSLPQSSAGERQLRADEVLQKLVSANPQVARAWLARYRYRRQYQLADADVDLDRALQLAPQDVAVLLAAGERAKDRGQTEQARRYLVRARELGPSEPGPLLALGDAERAAGQLEAALATWQQIPTESDELSVWQSLTRQCEVAQALGRAELAQQLLGQLGAHVERHAKQLTTRELKTRGARIDELERQVEAAQLSAQGTKADEPTEAVRPEAP